uniref:Signal recognition particle 54 kDa protein n=1 Tax=Promethearchaeum syntrophicum TaxID=2594042 RepID=A0A5B9D956_9ARCH|nr:Signal recognition particle 54 kDa protein [Candidatus Prometheoarchaeum syntrophicum]
MVLNDLGKSLDSLIRKIRRLPEIDKDAINGILLELQRALLMADVNVELCLQLTENIKKRSMDQKINKKIERKEFIIKIVHDELINILGGDNAPKRIKTGKQSIILLVGIQGSGKTTSIGKLANFYKKKGFKIGVICTDTWRPGAYDQLAQTCDSIKVSHFGMPEEKNAIKIAKKGLRHFIKTGKDQKDLIIVDTAGRHKQETALMQEMQKLENIIKPNETILVIDGTLGQQAYAQALAFAQTTHVGSIIITKLDGSAKGGGALSAAAASGAPIKFIGVGEKVDDLEEFHASKFIGTLLGIPDIEGLIEKVKELELEPDEDQMKRMMKGKFTLDDMHLQLKSLDKMGGFSKILAMMGGQNIPEQAKVLAEANLDKWDYVLGSMTKFEKDNPDVIRKTRITRIARGSGTTYTEIKQMLKQYSQMKVFMKGILGKKRRGKKGQPGAGGIPGLDGGQMPDMQEMAEMQQKMMQGKKKRKKHPW